MNDTPTDRLDDLMDRYVFDLLDSSTADRVRRKIEGDPEWQLAYEAAVARKRALAAGIMADASGSDPAGRIDPGRIASEARAKEARQLHRRRVAWRVLGGMAAAAAVLLAVAWIRVAAISPPNQVIHLLGQTDLMAGSVASLRAFVSDLAGRASIGVPVRITLGSRKTGSSVVLANWVTDSSGNAAGQVNIPDWPDGQYELVATSGRGTPVTLEVPITIKRAYRIYLAVDKPIYQPGQTIHMRCLVLQKLSLRPFSGGEAEFSVTDPAGNVIFRQPEKLSEFGIASADLPLDELINTGRYQVKVAVGPDSSEQTVEIFHYKLPAFSVKVDLDKPYYLPDQTVRAVVQVDYHFGQPVVGASVGLEVLDRSLGKAEPLHRANGMTGAGGKAFFEIRLPAMLAGSPRTGQDAHLLLSARVIDTAGQENVGYATIPVAQQDIRIAVVAENGMFCPGLENRLFIVTSYPDGRPAQTVVDIESLAQSVRTNEAGVAIVAVRSAPDPCRIAARDTAGRSGRISASLPSGGSDGFILRTDRPSYTAGQTVAVELLAGQDGEVFLDLIQDRQTILTKALKTSNGRATLAVDIPLEVAGTLRLHAYRLNSQGEWVGRDALIVVRPSRQLAVGVQKDRDEYRPGKDATLTFHVSDDSGRPVPSALSLAAVDEAVYSVQQAAGGLEATLSGLDEELLTPAIEAHDFSVGLMDRDQDYARAALAAALVQRPQKPYTLEQIERLAYLPRTGIWSRSEIQDALRHNPQLQEQLGPELIRHLIGDSGPHTLDWDNKHETEARYYHERHKARELAESVTTVVVVIAVMCLLVLAIRWVVSTPGKPVSAGSIVLRIVLALLVLLVIIISILLPSLHTAKELAKTTALSSELRSLYPAAVMAEPAPEQPPQPAGQARVRTYFPETMLWRPQVITDENGLATLTFPLADSITTWRLAGTAVGKAGQLGSIHSSIRVFQPFFVDIDAPISLTVGDEVSVPVVLYNYTGAELAVSLAAGGSDGLVVLENAKQEIVLAASEVKRALVRVRAETAGQAALTVNAASGNVADAIRRSIGIVPPGLPQSISVNGVLADGAQDVDVVVPSDAVPGSAGIQMKVYPSRFSELIDGLEGILRMPHGCFEQTSSSTYPNIMALACMKAEGIGSPEILARATQYIHLGYQRLLSFEVNGGGFSLYGQSPANVPLTAYGMMEFADMAKVHNVDLGILTRTAKWLTKQQAADGSWQGYLPMSYGAGRGDNVAITAYVTWALAEYDPACEAARLGAAYVRRYLREASDPHTLALCVNALLATNGSDPSGLTAANRLADMAQHMNRNDCHWPAEGARLIYSRGGYGDVETTALAALALARTSSHIPVVNDALRWIVSRRDPDGTWGTTQSTVMALKALLAGRGTPTPRDKEARISVLLPDRDTEVGQVVIRPEESDVVHQVRLDMPTAPGRYRLRLQCSQAVGMAYQLVVRYHSVAAAPSTSAGGLTIKVDYDRTQLETGGTVKVVARITNDSTQPAGLPLVDLGTPPGFVVLPEGLDRLQEEGKIDRYTLTSRGVIIYLKTLPPHETVLIQYEIKARMPIRALSAPSTVYPYYDPAQRAAAFPAMFTVD